MTIRRRIERLEQVRGVDRLEFVGIGEVDWTPAQLEAAAAEAQKRRGLRGTVVMVQYAEDCNGRYPTLKRYDPAGGGAGGLLPVSELVTALKAADKALSEDD